MPTTAPRFHQRMEDPLPAMTYQKKKKQRLMRSKERIAEVALAKSRAHLGGSDMLNDGGGPTAAIAAAAEAVPSAACASVSGGGTCGS